MDIEKIKEKLKATLEDRRYKHSLGVADEARKLAKKWGADGDKAYLAGLIHDCAKGMSMEKSISICPDLDKDTLACPPVVHAPVGAELARLEYGIDDNEILDSIRYHTVARANMTTLDKIIYLADMIEPMRDFDGVEIIRELAKTDLDRAYKEAVKTSLMFNINKETIIHPKTLEAWNEIIDKGGKRYDSI